MNDCIRYQDKLHDWVDVTLALKPRAGSICTVQSAERQHLGVHSERPCRQA